jgi:hypothetical protein
MGGAIQPKGSDPIEKHLAELLGRKRVLTEDLRFLITEVGKEDVTRVVPLPNLKRATKKAMLECIAANWAGVESRFGAISTARRRIPTGEAVCPIGTERII